MVYIYNYQFSKHLKIILYYLIGLFKCIYIGDNIFIYIYIIIIFYLLFEEYSMAIKNILPPFNNSRGIYKYNNSLFYFPFVLLIIFINNITNKQLLYFSIIFKHTILTAQLLFLFVCNNILISRFPLSAKHTFYFYIIKNCFKNILFIRLNIYYMQQIHLFKTKMLTLLISITIT